MSVKRLGVLVSSGGRSLENLSERIAQGELEASLALVVSDRADALALERAKRLGIPSLVVPYGGRAESAVFSKRIFEALSEARCDVVVLAGFLRLLEVPAEWSGSVLNIHPSLLPAFGGKGFYGDRVHRAVVERGVEFTGCTVHFVDDRYDEGPIILQQIVEVAPSDTPGDVAANVFEAEKRALPEAIRRVLAKASTPEHPRGAIAAR